MRLHFESFGAGVPVIILHGLFGSLDNWLGFARSISGQFRVLLADQRNHGRSPHSDTMSYGEMAEDIRDMMDRVGLSRAIIIGHSMGGKTAMQFALDFPVRVQKLVCVDIAPRRYEARHNKILKALSGLDPSAYHSRQAMELALAPCIPDIQVRRFLLKGVHLEEGTFRWRMGIHEIAGNYDKLSAEIKGSGVFDGPVLFVRGELSDYLRPEDEPRILRSFPNAKFCCIPNASHWVHADNPEGFRRPVAEFLEQP